MRSVDSILDSAINSDSVLCLPYNAVIELVTSTKKLVMCDSLLSITILQLDGYKEVILLRDQRYDLLIAENGISQSMIDSLKKQNRILKGAGILVFIGLIASFVF